MTAQALLSLYGGSLLGRHVVTVQIGEYPGGLAEVIELLPDPAAPEIVFNVNHPTFGEIGVFDWEPVQLVNLGVSP